MESHALSLFLRGIKDPDFEMTAEIQYYKDDNTLMQSVINIWKQDRGGIKKGYTDRKFRNKMRCVYEDDEFYLDKYRPFKRSRLQGEKYENLVVTSDHIKFKGKLLHVVQSVCQELDAKDREFVVAYNRKVEHNESTDEIYVPANFRALIKDKFSTPRSSTPRENQSRPRRKIIFKLQHDEKE